MMKVTIETNGTEARTLLNATQLDSLAIEFWSWLRGPGRESTSGEIAAKYAELAYLNNLNLQE